MSILEFIQRLQTLAAGHDAMSLDDRRAELREMLEAEISALNEAAGTNYVLVDNSLQE